MFKFSPVQERSIEVTNDGNNELVCPDCGSNYLHHLNVRFMSRTAGEDGPGTVTTVAGDGSAQIRAADAKELPGRRDSVHISFSCEGCGENAAEKVLELKQHKGNTVVTWVHSPS